MTFCHEAVDFWPSSQGKHPLLQYDGAFYSLRTSSYSTDNLRRTFTYECTQCSTQMIFKVGRSNNNEADFPNNLQEATTILSWNGKNSQHTCSMEVREDEYIRRSFKKELYEGTQNLEVNTSQNGNRRFYNRLCEKYVEQFERLQVARIIPYWGGMRHSTRRQAVKSLPPSPSTMEALLTMDCFPEELQNTLSNDEAFILSFFEYTEDDGSQSCVIIFGTDSNLRLLLEADHVMSDSTYKVTPQPFRKGICG